MLDLEKIKAFEMPFFEKEIYVVGGLQKVRIYAMHDTTTINVLNLDEKNPEDKLNFLILILCDVLRIDKEDAKKLADVDILAANEIVSSAMDFTKEYDRKRKEERELAIKNFKATQKTNM